MMTASNTQLFQFILAQDRETKNVAEAGFEPRSGLLKKKEWGGVSGGEKERERD